MCRSCPQRLKPQLSTPVYRSGKPLRHPKTKSKTKAKSIQKTKAKTNSKTRAKSIQKTKAKTNSKQKQMQKQNQKQKQIQKQKQKQKQKQEQKQKQKQEQKQKQKQKQKQEPSWTLPWNPTLAQKTRKDGAPAAPNRRNQKSRRWPLPDIAQALHNIDFGCVICGDD